MYWLKKDGKFAHYGITGRGNAQWVGFHLNVKVTNKFHSNFKSKHLQAIIRQKNSLKVVFVEKYKKKSGDKLLAVMPVPKAFLKLALPAIAAQLINILYNLVDKMFIGHIPGVGKQALAGVGVFLRQQFHRFLQMIWI